MSSLAMQFIQAVTAGNFEEATTQFTRRLGAAYTASALADDWSSLEEQFGSFVGVRDSESITVQGHDATVLTLEFVGGAQRIRLVHDGDAIAGIQYLGPEEVSYAPPSYVGDDVTETECTVESDAGELPGTLALPAGDPSVGVVLIHGSGPLDRDGTVDGSKPLKDLALGLASEGIAVLRYDKRTAVETVPPAEYTADRVAVTDAVAAVEQLRERVDEVFVVGHSFGGMVAPLIASRTDSVAGLALLAANARRLSTLVLEQSERFSNERTRAEIAAGVERIRTEELRPGKKVLGFPGSFWQSLDGYDPVEAAAELPMPMFVFQGELDRQVSHERDFGRWRDAFGDDPRVAFRSYEGLDHLFRPSEGPKAAREHVAAEVVTGLATLLLEERRD